jgi:hypothetical protein
MWTGNFVKFFSSKYISSLIFFLMLSRQKIMGSDFPISSEIKKTEKEKKGSGSVFHRVWDPET